MEFTTTSGEELYVDTFDSDGKVKNKKYLSEGAEPEEAEALIIPVVIENNQWNDKLQDVKINETVKFGPGETTLFPLKVQEKPRNGLPIRRYNLIKTS